MVHSDFSIGLCKDRLREMAMKASTPKKYSGVMFEACEIICQLQNAQDGVNLDTRCGNMYTMGLITALHRAGTGAKCRECGCELQSYYCENQLYLVRCLTCSKLALIKERSPEKAALATFGVLPKEVANETYQI